MSNKVINTKLVNKNMSMAFMSTVIGNQFVLLGAPVVGITLLGSGIGFFVLFLYDLAEEMGQTKKIASVARSLKNKEDVVTSESGEFSRDDIRLSRGAADVFQNIGGKVASETIKLAAEVAYSEKTKSISKECLLTCFYIKARKMVGIDPGADHV